MPRGPRIQIPGAYYHVYGRGNRRQALYHDDEDRRVFLDRYERIASNLGAIHVAHCQMPNHFHLLLRPGSGGLPRVMHRVLSSYSNWFNRRHAAVGHLFQGRYGSRPIESVVDLLTVLRYIHLNPVAAGMVSDPSRWPWSSHASHLSLRPPEFLSRGVGLIRILLGDGEANGLSRYRELMKLPRPHRSEVFRRIAPLPTQGHFAPHLETGETPTLESLVARTATDHGVTLTDLIGRCRKRALVAARRDLARVASSEHGYPLTAIANSLGCSPQAIHKLLATLAPNPGRVDRPRRVLREKVES